MKSTLPWIAILAAMISVVPLAADPLSPPTKAEQIMLPKLSFKKARVHEAVKFLTRKSRDLDPTKTGVVIVFAAPPNDETRVSVELADISIAGAAKKLADTANLEMRSEGDRIILKPKLTAAPNPVGPNNPRIPGTPRPGIPELSPIPK